MIPSDLGFDSTENSRQHWPKLTKTKSGAVFSILYTIIFLELSPKKSVEDPCLVRVDMRSLLPMPHLPGHARLMGRSWLCYWH